MSLQLFGYVSANPKMMNDSEMQRYRGFYCGLCRCLGKRHGQLTRLSLTYDMTFLAVFLSAMYEPEEQNEEFWCVLHPKGRHGSVITKYTEYAADMNVLLAYYNCLDNWKDEKKLTALAESAVFKKSAVRVSGMYPRQSQAVVRELAELERLERERCADPEQPANCFGRLLGELFVVNATDHFAEDMRQFGFYLGKFIYLYDAVMDYNEDRGSGSYNPIAVVYGDDFHEETAKQLLTYYISACVECFERLPIVQDSAIIKNILYSGVWQEFQKKFGETGNGSIEE